jgi:hypothetical protein
MLILPTPKIVMPSNSGINKFLKLPLKSNVSHCLGFSFCDRNQSKPNPNPKTFKLTLQLTKKTDCWLLTPSFSLYGGRQKGGKLTLMETFGVLFHFCVPSSTHQTAMKMKIFVHPSR